MSPPGIESRIFCVWDKCHCAIEAGTFRLIIWIGIVVEIQLLVWSSIPNRRTNYFFSFYNVILFNSLGSNFYLFFFDYSLLVNYCHSFDLVFCYCCWSLEKWNFIIIGDRNCLSSLQRLSRKMAAQWYFPSCSHVHLDVSCFVLFKLSDTFSKELYRTQEFIWEL